MFMSNRIIREKNKLIKYSTAKMLSSSVMTITKQFSTFILWIMVIIMYLYILFIAEILYVIHTEVEKRIKTQDFVYIS